MISFDELMGVKCTTQQKIMPIIDPLIPWVDKYRPKRISDLVHHENIIQMLNKILETGDMPHLLLYGPPGTGKTSSILSLGMELFGRKKFNERVIELNASDERGIDIVRKKLLNLAKLSVSEADPNYLCPDYKIVVLDEADSSTISIEKNNRRLFAKNKILFHMQLHKPNIGADCVEVCQNKV
jgi:replication factor C subunit 2/4